MAKVISLVGLLVILGLSIGFDRWTLFLEMAAKTINPAPVMWAYIFGNLFLATCLLLLAWFVVVRSGRSLLVSSVFLLVGLYSILSLVAVVAPLPEPLFVLLAPRVDKLFASSPTSFFSRSSVLVAVIGLFALLPKKWIVA